MHTQVFKNLPRMFLSEGTDGDVAERSRQDASHTNFDHQDIMWMRLTPLQSLSVVDNVIDVGL